VHPMKKRSQRDRSTLSFNQLEPKQLLAGDLGDLNLLTNGDFETVATPSDRPNFFNSEDVAGFNAVNAADGQQIVLFTFGTGDETNTVLRLDSTDDQIDFVSQDVVTEEDETYIVTFDLRGQVINGQDIVENIEVFWNGELAGVFESTDIFTTHALIVTGVGGTSTLEFREAADGDSAAGNGVGVLLDNVNVVIAEETSGVTNGSFEETIGAGPFFSNGNVPGFTALDRGGRPDLIQIQSNGENPNALATDGTQVLNLDTTSEVVDHVFADFETIEGVTYFVTFDLFADGPQDANPDEVRVRWRTPDSEILTDQWIATVFGTDSFQSYGFLVTGLGDLSRLELREPAGSPGDGSGALIDNIQLFAIDGIVNDLVVDANGPASGTSAVVELMQGAGGIEVAPDLTISHPSGVNLTGATITIDQATASDEDGLIVLNAGTDITQTFDASSGVLTLAGTATIEEYQTVLRTLRFEGTGDTLETGTRTLSIVVTDSAIVGADDDSAPVTVGVDIVPDTLALSAIEPQTVEAGSPLFVSLDVSNLAGSELEFSAVSGDTSILTSQFETGDSLRLNISAPDAETNGQATPLSGEITFQLFEEVFGDAGSRATDRIRTLTEQGFFDGIEFHRIAADFVIQAGDPTGTGAGGSELDDFDDQFNTLLQHNRSGLLSFAKSLDDTNNSQFFVTDTATRFLDFQHTIFGVITSGDDLRAAINDVDTGVNPNTPAVGEFPTGVVTIESAEIFQDNERAAVLLVAPEGVTGETTLTVTVTDAAGNQSTQEIVVNVVAPTGPFTNGNPFLDDIPDLTATEGVEQTFQLTAQDVEDDDVVFLDLEEIQDINSGIAFSPILIPSFADDPSFTYDVDRETGLITFTAGENSPETVEFLVGVAPDGQAINNGNVDLQVVTVNVSSATCNLRVPYVFANSCIARGEAHAETFLNGLL